MKNCFFCHADCPYAGIDGCWGEDCLDINDGGPIEPEDVEDCEDMEDEGC